MRSPEVACIYYQAADAALLHGHGIKQPGVHPKKTRESQEYNATDFGRYMLRRAWRELHGLAHHEA